MARPSWRGSVAGMAAGWKRLTFTRGAHVCSGCTDGVRRGAALRPADSRGIKRRAAPGGCGADYALAHHHGPVAWRLTVSRVQDAPGRTIPRTAPPHT